MKCQQFILSGLVFILFHGLFMQPVFAQSMASKDTQPVAGSDTIWYSQPWVWFIGVAVVVLAIIYVIRNSKNKSLRGGTQKGLR